MVVGLLFIYSRFFFKKKLKLYINQSSSPIYSNIFLAIENINHVLFPLLGLFIFFEGLEQIPFFGLYHNLFISHAFMITSIFIISNWLVLSLASRSVRVGQFFDFKETQERYLISLVNKLAALFAAILFIDMLNLGFVLSQKSIANLYFPLIIMISIILFSLNRKITDSGNYQIAGKNYGFITVFLNKSIFILTILIPFLSVLGFLEATLYLIKSINHKQDNKDDNYIIINKLNILRKFNLLYF